MTRQTDTLPATQEAAAALAATSVPDLLTKAYALTHQMDAAMAARSASGNRRRDDLRAQRDLITAEVLRRTGDDA